jgi:MFS family permease
MAVGFTGVGLCHGVVFLIGSVAVVNVGAAVLRPVVISQLSKRVEASRQGLVMGVNQAIFSMTAVLAPLLSGALINRGLYTSWAVAAATFVLIGLFTTLALKPLEGSVPQFV